MSFLSNIFLFRPAINLLWGHMSSHNKFRPDHSAVLTFKGYKQTNKQTDKQSILIDIDI